jgi:hypothetical protein
MSRRQFVESSVITGLAGFVPSLIAFGDVRTPETAPEPLTLRVDGNRETGYVVAILFQGQPIARHKGGGDFSAFFQNGERSLEDRVEDWKARSWTGNEGHVTLTGDCTLKNLNTMVSVQVEYVVVTPQIVRKRIRFHQVDIFLLFYQMTNCLTPMEPPAKFWSFDQLDCQGGALHEHFPSAGFRTERSVTVGLLTDSGYRNQWSRFIRRDAKPLKIAPPLIPDVNLSCVCRNQERKSHQFFVKQTFGEALMQRDNQSAGELMALPPPSSWHKQGDARVEERSGTAVLSVDSSDAGVIIPFAAKDGEIYSLQFNYHAPQPFSLQLWDVDPRLNQLQNITLYNDRIPGSPTEWSEFRTTVFFYSLRGTGRHGSCRRHNRSRPSNRDRLSAQCRSRCEIWNSAACLRFCSPIIDWRWTVPIKKRPLFSWTTGLQIPCAVIVCHLSGASLRASISKELRRKKCSIRT